MTYDPIIEELNEIYSHLTPEQKGAVRVLVPGAGLGRLAFDIAKSGMQEKHNQNIVLINLHYLHYLLGFSCQGNLHI